MKKEKVMDEKQRDLIPRTKKEILLATLENYAHQIRAEIDRAGEAIKKKKDEIALLEKELADINQSKAIAEEKFAENGK